MAFAADAALHSGFACRPAGALLYLLNLLNLLNTSCRVVCASAPLPKAWRAKPAMPLQALRAGRVPLVEVWKLRGLEAWLFQRLHPSRACRAFCSLFSVAVEGLARCACTLCSPGRVSAPCPACASTPPVSVPLCLLCGLCVLRNLRFPILAVLLCAPLWSFVFFVIAPQREACPSLQTSKLLNFQKGPFWGPF